MQGKGNIGEFLGKRKCRNAYAPHRVGQLYLCGTAQPKGTVANGHHIIVLPIVVHTLGNDVHALIVGHIHSPHGRNLHLRRRGIVKRLIAEASAIEHIGTGLRQCSKNRYYR